MAEMKDGVSEFQYEESAEMGSTMMRTGESLEMISDDDQPQVDVEHGDESAEMHILEDDSVQGFFYHTEPVYSVACSPIDPADVITGGGDDRAFRWDLTTGDETSSLEKHGDSVISVRYSHDGLMFSTAGMDGLTNVYSSADSRLLHKLDGPSSEIEWMVWHPKGPVLAVGCTDGTTWLWHLSPASKTVLQVLSQDSNPTCGAFTGLDGKLLCTGSEEGTLRVWSCKTGHAVTVIKSGPLYHEGTISSLDTHPTQPIVLTGSQDEKVKWAHLESGKVLGTIADHRSAVEAVAFARSELQQNWAASGDMDGNIFVFDLDRGTIRARFSHDDGIVRLVWLKQRPYLLCSCSLDGTVRLWDTRTASCFQTFRGHNGPIYEITISADERFVVSCADDNTALVFSISDA